MALHNQFGKLPLRHYLVDSVHVTIVVLRDTRVVV
jgi:hypothetical protein